MIWLILLLCSINLANCIETTNNRTEDELVFVQIVSVVILEKIGLIQMKSFPLKFSYFDTATERSGNHVRSEKFRKIILKVRYYMLI